MNIQPLSPRPHELSVTEPIEPAYERVKQLLFRPFDLGRWFIIGFGAWLAGLGESGGGGGGFNNFHDSSHPNSANSASAGDQLRHFYHEARDYVLDNLVWIVPVTIVVVLAGLALWLLVIWLNSRGKFMFLHCVALNQAEVAVPWHRHARPANSLFRFRLVLCLIATVVLLPLLVATVAAVLRMVLRGEPDFPGVLLALVLGMFFFAFILLLVILKKFLLDFVVPIMFLRGGTCAAACREFASLLAAHPGQFALYLLFQIVLVMATGAIVLLAVLVTCCLVGCVLLLPFLGTVLLLPVLVFKRAYPLYYLAQFGPQYDVFPPAPAVPPVTA